ncbi:CopG family transcriptional regulator [Schaedlerella arabinosiphila]|uniref:CopG family transcriptional regulator n=1 Tax=Schaedlerella arabinosiphila TaxID=2044587 RepID=UPI002ED27FEC
MRRVSPRTGRPKSENPKNIDVKVRFDEESNKKLLEYCEYHHITRTEAIRKAVDLLLQQK